ncbi:MAG: DUF624 domain-containing protein, partial [Lachnospiraceae bacterium]|nr:DUF624 domain-containing protein [Lachnospiraceae bacterium]
MKLKKHTPVITPAGNNNRPSRLKEILTSGIPTLIIWNILFLITCIPIITIGPAMAAMGFCMNSLIRSDHPKKGAAMLYFHAFRASFMKALPVGIYFTFFTLLFGAGFFVYSYLSPENASYVSMSSISMVVLSFFWGFMMHMYPLMFEPSIAQSNPQVLRMELREQYGVTSPGNESDGYIGAIEDPQ